MKPSSTSPSTSSPTYPDHPIQTLLSFQPPSRIRPSSRHSRAVGNPSPRTGPLTLSPIVYPERSRREGSSGGWPTSSNPPHPSARHSETPRGIYNASPQITLSLKPTTAYTSSSSTRESIPRCGVAHPEPRRRVEPGGWPTSSNPPHPSKATHPYHHHFETPQGTYNAFPQITLPTETHHRLYVIPE